MNSVYWFPNEVFSFLVNQVRFTGFLPLLRVGNPGTGNTKKEVE